MKIYLTILLQLPKYVNISEVKQIKTGMTVLFGVDLAKAFDTVNHEIAL